MASRSPSDLEGLSLKKKKSATQTAFGLYSTKTRSRVSDSNNRHVPLWKKPTKNRALFSSFYNKHENFIVISFLLIPNDDVTVVILFASKSQKKFCSPTNKNPRSHVCLMYAACALRTPCHNNLRVEASIFTCAPVTKGAHSRTECPLASLPFQLSGFFNFPRVLLPHFHVLKIHSLLETQKKKKKEKNTLSSKCSFPLTLSLFPSASSARQRPSLNFLSLKSKTKPYSTHLPIPKPLLTYNNFLHFSFLNSNWFGFYKEAWSR